MPATFATEVAPLIGIPFGPGVVTTATFGSFIPASSVTFRFLDTSRLTGFTLSRFTHRTMAFAKRSACDCVKSGGLNLIGVKGRGKSLTADNHLIGVLERVQRTGPR